MPRQFEDMTLLDLEAEIEHCAIEIKRLENEALELQAEIRPMQDRRGRALGTVANLKAGVVEMEQEIIRRKAPKPEPTVTDHALLRYIERVHGIDIDALRETILTPKIREAIRAGAVAIKGDGFVGHVRGYSITTITTPEVHPERKNNKLTRAQRQRLEDDEMDDFEYISARINA